MLTPSSFQSLAARKCNQEISITNQDNAVGVAIFPLPFPNIINDRNQVSVAKA
jgi:hypothetical protein